MKKFLALFASFGLIASTTPTVVACAHSGLLGQYEPLTKAHYDKHDNLLLSKSQLTYLTFLQAADYLRDDSP